MSIRLICSDIDGTLLQYGKKELEDEIFEQIRELHRRGILFCPASGRQYTSLRKLFAPGHTGSTPPLPTKALVCAASAKLWTSTLPM